MRTCKILDTRYTLRFGRTCKCMPDQQIQPFTECMIKRRLQVIPERFLPVRTYSCKSFGKHQLSPVCVCRRGWLLHEETVLVPDPVPPRPCPEFAHRSIIKTQASLCINGHRVRAARFRVNQHSMPVSAVTEWTVMIVDSEITYRLLEIVHESVTGIPVVNNPACQDRHPWQHVVTAPLPEFLTDRRRPV